MAPVEDYLTLDQVLELLQADIAREQGRDRGARARYARTHFYNQECLPFVFTRRNLPGPAILEPLRLEKVILYRRKEQP